MKNQNIYREFCNDSYVYSSQSKKYLSQIATICCDIDTKRNAQRLASFTFDENWHY